MPVYDPSRFSEIPAGELLDAAARGFIGVDRRLVQSLLDRGPSAAAEVLAFGREENPEHKIDIDQVLVDLLRAWNAPGALELYMAIIRRNPEDVGDELIQALLPYKEEAIEPLLAVYEELGEESGSDVAFLLAGLRVRDPRVLALLLDRLEYDAGDGAFCLGLYGDSAARPALEKMLAQIPADDVELTREITYAIEQLDAPEPEYKPEPIDILKEYPKTDIPALDLLTDAERVDMLGSPDTDTRGAAAHSFFNHELGPKAKAALLQLAQTDPDPKVRGRAWASLADVTEDATIRDLMVAIVKDSTKEAAERGGAAVGLYGVADQEPAREAIEALYHESGPQQKVTRAKALEAMWRSLFEPFAKFFPDHLGDPEPEIVRQALRGAGYFQLTRQAEKIASYFDRDEPFDDVREDALFAYALAMPGETTRGRVKGMLRRIEELAQLDSSETELVMFALDERLRLNGMRPVFEEGAAEEPEAAAPVAATPAAKVGRNDPCPCGSGKKYKKCHGA
ncbi:MAG: SEC-C metal-binding domain-containing protein [Acidobacteriota bacterium]